MRMATIWMTLAAAVLGGAALGYDQVVIEREWYRVASDQADGCRGEVGTNGQFYVISVTGLSPGETGRLNLSNGDMVPIDWAIQATEQGRWQHYYLPFRPNRGEGAMVSAQISMASCELALEFPWQRRKGWEERPPLQNTRTR